MPVSPYVAELRRLVGSRRLLLPSVAVVVHDRAGRLLMVRHREDGAWGLPAGAVEPGESPRDAARRELLEETGWTASSLRLVGAAGGEEFRHRYPNGDEVEYQVFVYAADAPEGTDPTGARDDDEVVEVRFFARAEAPAPPLPYPVELLWRDEAATNSAAPAGGTGAGIVTVGLRPVRRARASDRVELVRMRRSLWPDSTAAEVDALLSGLGAVLVAERDGEGLAGFAEVGDRPFAEGCTSSPVAYLEGIWVDPDHRRKGVGAALVHAGMAWARAQGLTELASDADLTNAVSHRFHRALGFREVGRAVCFLRRLEA